MLQNTLQATPYNKIKEKGHDYHVNFYLRVKGRFMSFSSAFGSFPTLLQAQFACFDTAVGSEDDFFKATTASELTGDVKEWDIKRDNNTSSLRAMSSAFAMNPGDAVKQQAGQKVLDMMRHYKLNISDNYELQGSRTLQFCQAVDADSAAQQAIAAIGATAFYTALKEANEQCRLLIDQRNADRAAAPQEKMVNLRKATDNEYAHLLMITNAYALTDEQQRYNTLLLQLIEDVNYYEKVVFAGSGGTSSGGNSGNSGNTEQGGSSSEQGGSDSGNGGSDSDNDGGDNNGGGGTTPTPDPDAGFGGGGSDSGNGDNNGGGTTPQPDPDAGFGGS